ncbi:MAG TPA: NADH-quinone oxidoreductase subunit A [Pyrinomonadaceae bacterium]|jgi:NADH-quinone oxidoreductase subunit A|nr:NADH-quinone oxidoreductase subunit A [Pyrinomonadaceae bacterium]
MLSAFLLQASTTLTTTARNATGVGGVAAGYWPVLVFFAVAVVFPVLPVVLGRFVRPNLYGKAKMRPYECGIDPTTEAHDRFTVRFYIVAMLFLVFDVETIFLLPWAIIFMGDDFSFTKFALLEMFFFIGILVVGYYYAWRKGALEWA